ncbi:MAG: hypothetical protein DMF83_02070 [Acidobacteria bacterium]|nr:MAG: hypothetical protein DMF83_02070 [Acidobacteriota bacterium]
MFAPALFALLLLAPVASAEEAPRPVPRPGLSWAEAEALDRKLTAIEKQRVVAPRKSRPETVTVTESELNSYLNLTMAEKLPKEVKDLEVHLLEHERLQANGLVDLDKVKAKVAATSSSWNPLLLMGGFVPVQLRGRLVNRDGFGSIVWEDVQVNAWSLPISLLEQMVASATKKPDNPEGVDISAPFRLPYSVRRVRLEPGRAFLEF